MFNFYCITEFLNGAKRFKMAAVENHNDLADRDTSKIILECLVFSSMFLTALIGNVLVCFAFYKNSRLRHSLNNYFIVSLAVSDILMALLVETLTFGAFLTGRWPFRDTLCQFHGVCIFILGGVSLQTLMLIAVNRYFKMVKSDILYKKPFKKRTVLWMIAASWIFASIPLPVFLLSGNRFAFNTYRTVCYPDLSLRGVRTFLHYVYAIFIVIPSCVTIFCYFSVFKTIRAHNTQIASSDAIENTDIALRSFARESRVVKMLFVTMVGFQLCWTPLYILELIDSFHPDLHAPRTVYVMITFTVSASSSINPIIYAVMNKDFRDTFKSLLFGS